jgi:WhiB family redox-sensing transcriptional regulator
MLHPQLSGASATTLSLMDPHAVDYPTTIEEVLRRPAWHAQAACRGSGTEAFVIDAKKELSAEVLALCEGCQVRAECFEYAMAHPDLVGVWGGTTERERRVLRTKAA